MEAFTLRYFDIVGLGFYFYSLIARQIEAQTILGTSASFC